MHIHTNIYYDVFACIYKCTHCQKKCRSKNDIKILHRRDSKQCKIFQEMLKEEMGLSGDQLINARIAKGTRAEGRAKSQICIPREIGESQGSVLLPDTREKSSKWRVKDGKLSGAEVNGWRTALMEESWDDSPPLVSYGTCILVWKSLIEGRFAQSSSAREFPQRKHAQAENALMTTILLQT